MIERKVRWGIIGCGRIAEKVAADFQKVDSADLIAVAARERSRAEAFGQKFGVTKCFGDYESLAKDPEVEVVYIATIHPEHLNAVKLCLDHGKGVLCEKPLGMNSTEVTEMIELANSRKLFLMEAIWTRFIPAFDHALKMVNQGDIGDVKLVQADFGFKANPDVHRLFKKELGGGSLLDIGIYPLFVALLVLGMPLEIAATAVMNKNEVDDSCNMLLSYSNGASAILNATFMLDTQTEAWIHGSEGSLQLHHQFHHPEKLTHWKDHKVVHAYDFPIDGHGYKDEIDHVSKCLLRGEVESPLLPHDLSLNLSALLDAVRKEIGLTYP